MQKVSHTLESRGESHKPFLFYYKVKFKEISINGHSGTFAADLLTLRPAYNVEKTNTNVIREMNYVHTIEMRHMLCHGHRGLNVLEMVEMRRFSFSSFDDFSIYQSKF